MIKLIELFGGLGSFRKSLEDLNYEVNCEYIEIDKYAVKAYNLIFNENEIPKDIKTWSYIKKDKVDILTAGFPCQDISMAGKQDLSKGRSMLFQEIIRIVSEIKNDLRPDFIIIENVKSILQKKFSFIIEELINKICKLNYVWCSSILNALDFGIPQTRERYFLLFIKENKNIKNPFHNLQKEKLKLISYFLDQNVDENYYVKEEILEKLDTKKYFKNCNWLINENKFLEYKKNNFQLDINNKIVLENENKSVINISISNFKTSNVINLNYVKTLLTGRDIANILIPIYEINFEMQNQYNSANKIGKVLDNEKIIIPFTNYNRDNQCSIATGGGYYQNNSKLRNKCYFRRIERNISRKIIFKNRK